MVGPEVSTYTRSGCGRLGDKASRHWLLCENTTTAALPSGPTEEPMRSPHGFMPVATTDESENTGLPEALRVTCAVWKSTFVQAPLLLSSAHERRAPSPVCEPVIHMNAMGSVVARVPVL